MDKKQLKERINEKIIYNGEKEVTILNILIQNNKFSYAVNYKYNKLLNKTVIDNDTIPFSDTDISFNKEDREFIGTMNGSELSYFCNYTKYNSDTNYTQYNISGKVETDTNKKYLCTIIMCNSSQPPVFLIKENNGELINVNLVDIDKDIFYTSYKEPISMKVVKIADFTYDQSVPKTSFDGIFTSSSLSKESVKYDEDGNIIKYTNSFNGITMKSEKIENGYKNDYYLNGNLINTYINIKTEKEHIFGWKIGVLNTKKSLNEYNVDETANYSLTCMDSIYETITEYIFVDGISDDSLKRIINVDYSSTLESYNYVKDIDDNKNIKISMMKDNEEIISMNYSFNNVEYSIESKTFSFIKKHENMLMPFFTSTFKSESGIEFGYRYLDNRILGYTDNDISITFEDDGKIKEFKSFIHERGDSLYLRDQYGVPSQLLMEV